MSVPRDNWAIRAHGIGKQYALGGRAAPNDNLREDLMAGLARALRLTRSRNRFWALRDIDLEVAAGETLALIGRNGAGKSTLLKILSRITPPTTGEIRYRGRLASLLEVGTGFHRELTGRENIYLNGAVLGMRRAEIARQFDAIVAFAEVERFLDTPVKFYSSGMYVRLAFAVAAHLRTDILVVDEVLAVGDAAFQRKCLGRMRDVASQGRTVLFVSHNMGAVREMCRRGILLEEGRAIADGPAGDVVEEYLVRLAEQSGHEAAFPEEPSLPVQVRRLAVRDADGAPATRLPVGTESIIVEIEVEVREPLTGINTAVVLRRHGVDVLTTFDSDENDAALGRREPGVTRHRVRLPTGALKAGLYTVSAGVGYLNRAPLDSRRDAVSFVLEEREENVYSKGYAEQRPGVLRAPVRWEDAT